MKKSGEFKTEAGMNKMLLIKSTMNTGRKSVGLATPSKLNQPTSVDE